MINVFFNITFLAVLACLVFAGYFMMKNSNQANQKKRMVWVLTLRVGLCVLLFVSVWVFYSLGWIKPSGIPY